MKTLDSNDLDTVTGGRFSVAGGLYGGFGGRGGGLAMQMFNAQMMQQASLNNQGMNNPATIMACCMAMKAMMSA